MKRVLMLGLLASAMALTQAQTLSLVETVSVEVPQDELTAHLYVEESGASVSELNAAVGAKLRRALELRTPSVNITGAGIHTQPVYDKNGRTNRFTVRARVEVKSTDIAKASEVINKLANTMAFEGVTFSVSPTMRQKVSDSLMEEVSTRFQRKAQRAATALGYSRAELAEVSLNTSNGAPPRPMKLMAARAMAMEAQPDMGLSSAAGVETVETTLQGSVKLIK